MSRAGVMLIALLLACSPAWTSPPGPGTQAEISHLLSYLVDSGCDFYRNGSWYGPAEASDHLQRKLDYLVKRSLVTTTEDFIARAASSSSMSGEDYLVRCPGTAPVRSSAWLSEELKRYRSTAR